MSKFKQAIFFFLSLLLSTAAIGAKPLPVVAEGDSSDSSSSYTYTEEIYETKTVRIYDSSELAPTIEKHFCAPSGYAFTLSETSEQISKILTEADSAGADYRMTTFVYKYSMAGVDVYSDSNVTWSKSEETLEETKTRVAQEIYDSVNGTVLYKLSELHSETTISMIFIVNVTTPDSEIELQFKSESVVVEPYTENDFITIQATFFEDRITDDVRVTVFADIIEGFFSAPHGFQTDTLSDDGQPVYELVYLANDTNQIGDGASGGLEMSYPDYDFYVKARLRFTSGGVEYTYYSETINLKNPHMGVLIDGFNNRMAIQRGTEHIFGVNIGNLALEDVVFASVSLTATPTSLEESDSLQSYESISAFPETGEAGLCYYALEDGNYYLWDSESASYSLYDFTIGEFQYEYDTDGPFNGDTLCEFVSSFPLSGDYVFNIDLTVYTPRTTYCLMAQDQTFQVIDSDPGYTPIEGGLTFSCSDSYGFLDNTLNLVIDSSPVTLTSIINPEILNDYDTGDVSWNLSRSGVVELEVTGEKEVTIAPSSAGTVLLTCTANSETFSNLISSITIRVLDTLEGISYLDAGEGQYHNVDSPLHVSLKAKGYEAISGLDLEWEVLKKDGTSSSFTKNEDQSITIESPEYTDYTISATRHGVLLAKQTFEMVKEAPSPISTEEEYLTFNVPDSINLIAGAGDLTVVPSIASSLTEEDLIYHYSWSVSRNGVLALEEKEDGKVILSPLNAGLVNLTLTVDSKLFTGLSKTISVRVLDTLYDVAKLQVPEEFHYAGDDLTVSLDVRGFTHFANLAIDWTITDKEGNPLGEEKYRDNGDATLTLLSPESNDYTITASFEGIELGKETIQVRRINVNQFVRDNIWWIFLITIAFVALIFVLRNLTQRGRSTVKSIERVYDVYRACLTDDKLTEAELKKIKRELTSCLHRCEDLNIDALNQYEKAIRYLRKSLNETKALLKEWDSFSPEDKAVATSQLDKDLSKALNVAKEIEDAKERSSQYHAEANRHNYETLDQGKKKK